MEMFNPPSPGEIIIEIFLLPLDISQSKCAEQLGLPLDIFKRLLSVEVSIDNDLAQRLSAVLGRSAESWLAMQQHYDNWQAKQARV